MNTSRLAFIRSHRLYTYLILNHFFFVRSLAFFFVRAFTLAIGIPQPSPLPMRPKGEVVGHFSFFPRGFVPFLLRGIVVGAAKRIHALNSLDRLTVTLHVCENPIYFFCSHLVCQAAPLRYYFDGENESNYSGPPAAQLFHRLLLHRSDFSETGEKCVEWAIWHVFETSDTRFRWQCIRLKWKYR